MTPGKVQSFHIWYYLLLLCLYFDLLVDHVEEQQVLDGFHYQFLYAQYSQLTDDQFVKENIEWMKKEVGLKS